MYSISTQLYDNQRYSTRISLYVALCLVNYLCRTRAGTARLQKKIANLLIGCEITEPRQGAAAGRLFYPRPAYHFYGSFMCLTYVVFRPAATLCPAKSNKLYRLRGAGAVSVTVE